MYRLNHLLISVILLIVSQSTFAVSPWMLSEGEMYYSGGVSYATGDQRWDEDRNLRDSSCRSKNWRSNHRVEYGYSYYHTLIASLGLTDKQCGDESYTGLGDLRIGIRGRIDVFRNGRSWELTAIIPTGYSSNDPGRPGNGKFGVEGGIAYLWRGNERTFLPLWNFQAGASVRLWLDGPADQFLSYVSAKRKIGKHRSISFRLKSSFSFENADTIDDNLADGTSFSDHDKITASVKWSDRVNDDWRYHIRAAHTVWGRNAGHNMQVGISFSRHWRL